MLKKLFMLMAVMVLTGATAYAAPADLPETGQTICYDAAGAVIACANTGQDGDLKKGVAWPSPRFTVDGTGLCVTDNLTGLMWVKTPDSTTRTWATALTYANGLSICGCGDWRLPNVNELESLIHTGYNEKDCSGSGGSNPCATNAEWLKSQGFINVQANNYWSSSTYAFDTTIAWYVSMWDGFVDLGVKGFNYYVWPVRAGQ